MKLFRNVLAAGIAVAAVSMAACSSGQATTGTVGTNGGSSVLGNQGKDGVGQVHMNLDIGPGISLTSFTYVINGPNTYTNSITIGDAQSLEFVVGGIVAGTGYTLTINGTDSSGDVCTGATSAPFSIVAGSVTQTVLAVTCTQPADASVGATVNTGSLEVDASVKLVGTAAPVCPGINSFAISPAELAAGQSAALALLDTDPTAIVTWSVSPAGGGVFGPTNAATASTLNTTFACTNTAPQVTVTATVVSASATAAALCVGKPFQTMSALVNCEPPSGGFTCPPQFGNPALTTACNVDAAVPFCADTTSDVNNCGGCGHVCSPVTAGDTVTCVASTCHEAAPPLTVCTTAPCTAGQVTCSNAAGGVCTKTEAAFVALDAPTVAGPASGACYSCLLGGSCLDTTHIHGQECDDFAGNFTNGSSASVNGASACLATLNCEIGSTGNLCLNSTNGITACYCGSQGGAPTACASAGTNVNGACSAQNIAGFKYAASDSNDIVINFSDSTQPSGLANSVISCAAANGCTACLQ